MYLFLKRRITCYFSSRQQLNYQSIRYKYVFFFKMKRRVPKFIWAELMTDLIAIVMCSQTLYFRQFERSQNCIFLVTDVLIIERVPKFIWAGCAIVMCCLNFEDLSFIGVNGYWPVSVQQNVWLLNFLCQLEISIAQKWRSSYTLQIKEQKNICCQNLYNGVAIHSSSPFIYKSRWQNF